MKELSIEEKAKAYDEAKARMSKAYNDNRCTISFMNEIFPELAKSKDEKIRKAMIKYFTNGKEYLSLTPYSREDYIAWLEKYGEQNPADKVEPKFKVGDIITNGILIGEIDEIHEWGYHAYFGDHYADVPDVENWHKWTIQDAKANAGYEGNADKKELKKIEQKSTIIPKFKAGDVIRHKEQGFTCKIIAVDTEYRLSECNGTHLPFDFQDAWELVEQKSAEWSEEDKSLCRQIEGILSVCRTKSLLSFDLYKKMLDWLKSLKDRKTWKPSIAQLNALSIVSKGNAPDDIEAIVSLYNDLEKLREK